MRVKITNGDDYIDVTGDDPATIAKCVDLYYVARATYYASLERAQRESVLNHALQTVRRYAPQFLRRGIPLTLK